jgi:outer membrane lipoprotein-sorting protein
MKATGMRGKKIVIMAAVLLCAACQRQEEPAPPAQPAAPGAAAPPTQELPAPDTGGASGAPQAAAGPATAEPQASAPSPGRPTRSGTTAAGAGRTPSPATGSKPQATNSSPAPEPTASASQDQGAAVLQRAATAYANLRALKADFVMQHSNPLLRQQTTSRGTLYQRRPDRIALRFTDPAGDVILSDGQFYWIYYPSVDAQQVIRCPAAGGEQGVDLQAQFVGDPVQRFRYTLHGQESVGGRPAHVLTLEPREQAEYRTLKVWLDTRDSLARRFEITEHNSTVRRFELSDFAVNASIPDATFRFTPPPNARIVSCS